MTRFLIGFAVCAFAADAPTIDFRDVAPSAGLTFVLHNSPTPRKHMIETMPGGVAAFDYDNDGRTDLYFTNGAEIPSLEKTSNQYWNRLYRNEGSMKFRDVTESAGVAGAGYSMGAAAGDYNNDGKVDLFVAGVRRNQLFLNLGDGKFSEVTSKAGIRSDLWSVAAGWFDYDNDGRLDLFVVNYAKWTAAWDRFCGDSVKNIRVYCHPKYFEGLSNTLYRNKGDGTFEDVTAKSGIEASIGRGMSVAFADYDADGHIDAFVTNDNLPNFLFRNKGDGTFEEMGLLAGVALLEHGKPVASMGTDFRDVNGDGKPDITVTALAGETYPLFLNQGGGNFKDATYSAKLGQSTTPHSGWGNGVFDFNNDGHKDLFTANSHVNDLVEQFEPHPYKEPNTVFPGLGSSSFGPAIVVGTAAAHRGAAFADFDQDGRIDVAVSALESRAELWQNTSTPGHHWLIVKLTGTRSNRDGIGAVLRAGDQWNQMTSSVGYASSSLFGVHFGLGTAMNTDLEIRWPSGRVQTLKDVAADQVLKVTEP